MRAEEAAQRRVEGLFEYECDWWAGMGRLWVELAVEECVNLEGWVEGLRGVVGRQRGEGVVLVDGAKGLGEV